MALVDLIPQPAVAQAVVESREEPKPERAIVEAVAAVLERGPVATPPDEADPERDAWLAYWRSYEELTPPGPARLSRLLFSQGRDIFGGLALGPDLADEVRYDNYAHQVFELTIPEGDDDLIYSVSSVRTVYFPIFTRRHPHVSHLLLFQRARHERSSTDLFLGSIAFRHRDDEHHEGDSVMVNPMELCRAEFPADDVEFLPRWWKHSPRAMELRGEEVPPSDKEIK